MEHDSFHATEKLYLTWDGRYVARPTTDEEALELLPPSSIPVERDYYKLRRQMGDTVIEALTKVYKAMVGETQ